MRAPIPPESSPVCLFFREAGFLYSRARLDKLQPLSFLKMGRLHSSFSAVYNQPGVGTGEHHGHDFTPFETSTHHIISSSSSAEDLREQALSSQGSSGNGRHGRLLSAPHLLFLVAPEPPSAAAVVRLENRAGS